MRILLAVGAFANLLSTRHQLLHQTATSSETCWLYPRPTYQYALGLGQILKRVKRFNSAFSSFVISSFRPLVVYSMRRGLIAHRVSF